MEITLWGVRGSISSPSSATQYYGPNTPCIELRTEDDMFLVFDAGSGIRLLGESLPDKGTCHLFITHGHLDHVQGLGFFKPLHHPGWTTHLYLPEWLANLPENYFNGTLFPIAFNSLRGNTIRHLVIPGTPLQLTSPQGTPVQVEGMLTNHPGGNMAYRVQTEGLTFFYSGDHEITDSPEVWASTKTMLDGAHVAIVDASYNRSDKMPGWGHSTWEDWVEATKGVDVGCLVLSHHQPSRTDAELDALQRNLLMYKEEGTPPMYVARENMRLLPPTYPPYQPESSTWLNEFLEDLALYREENVILDRILAKARHITRADAGTMFLAEGNELVFAYTHNDTFFHVNSSYRYAYVNLRMPISRESLAGYAAATGATLNIPNVHQLPADSTYKFNSEFDAKTGYQTQSMLTMPFFGRNKQLLGVLQLLNSIHPRTKQPCPFTSDMEASVRILAREAAKFLEFGSILRQNIYRMLHITAIHDPRETGPHAERVGAITAELYQRWAEKQDISPDQIRHFKSQLRMAAMLHDIGKIGISDLVLKKPGKLTPAEFTVMRDHVSLGGALLASEDQDITELACLIARHHHQRWNGTGYAGSGQEGLLAGEDIPLVARLTALADVFDALVSPRCYKAPWSFEDALGYIQEESGKHFDPELVTCFLEISDIVRMIGKRYPDTSLASALLPPVD